MSGYILNPYNSPSRPNLQYFLTLVTSWVVCPSKEKHSPFICQVFQASYPARTFGSLLCGPSHLGVGMKSCGWHLRCQSYSEKSHFVHLFVDFQRIPLQLQKFIRGFTDGFDVRKFTHKSQRSFWWVARKSCTNTWPQAMPLLALPTPSVQFAKYHWPVKANWQLQLRCLEIGYGCKRPDQRTKVEASTLGRHTKPSFENG